MIDHGNFGSFYAIMKVIYPCLIILSENFNPFSVASEPNKCIFIIVWLIVTSGFDSMNIYD